VFSGLDDIVLFDCHCLTFVSVFNPVFGVRLVDLLTRLLRVDPTQRITAAQALEHPFLTGIALEDVDGKLGERLLFFGGLGLFETV
jgi:serine/threonine protein kinase